MVRVAVTCSQANYLAMTALLLVALQLNNLPLALQPLWVRGSWAPERHIHFQTFYRVAHEQVKMENKIRAVLHGWPGPKSIASPRPGVGLSSCCATGIDTVFQTRHDHAMIFPVGQKPRLGLCATVLVSLLWTVAPQLGTETLSPAKLGLLAALSLIASRQIGCSFLSFADLNRCVWTILEIDVLSIQSTAIGPLREFLTFSTF